jgi:3-deoxy-manno-octulosonate cytidylyltransferase (CMP-KDO synthetase)
MLRNRDQRILCGIPARYKSTRFPGKPLTPIEGRPMIIHVAETAKKVLDWTVVATEDERIVKACKDWGVEAVLTSDKHPTGTDRIAELARRLEANYVVNVQGDEPLLPAEQLKTFVTAATSSDLPVTNAMAMLPSGVDPSDVTIPKVVYTPDLELVYISRSVVPNFAKSQQRPPLFRQIGLYGLSSAAAKAFSEHPRGTLERVEDIEILRFLDLRTRVKMVLLDDYGPAVDNPEHVKLVEDELRRRKSKAGSSTEARALKPSLRKARGAREP